MLFAAPSPTVLEMERLTSNMINHTLLGFLFIIFAALLALDYTATPRRFLFYLTPWLAYVLAVMLLAVDRLLTGHNTPGIYLANLAYIGEIVFMLLAYSVYGTVAQVSEYIATHEPYWKSLLSKTDLGRYED